MQHPESSSERSVIYIVVAIAVAICVVSAVTFMMWMMAGGLTDDVVYPSHELNLSVARVGGNFSMFVGHALGDMRPSEVYMTILDHNGEVKSPMSSVPLDELTPSNWSTYKAEFQKLYPSIYVGVGDAIMVNNTVYPSGYRYEVRFAAMNLATGYFP